MLRSTHTNILSAALQRRRSHSETGKFLITTARAKLQKLCALCVHAVTVHTHLYRYEAACHR
jgi:hypothetical protein